MADGGVVGEVVPFEEVPFDIGFDIGKGGSDDFLKSGGDIGSANLAEGTKASGIQHVEESPGAQRGRDDGKGVDADVDELSMDENEDILKPDETLESILLKVGMKRRKVEQRRQRKQTAGKKKLEKMLDKRQRAYKGTDDSAPTQLLVEGVWFKADEVEQTQRTRYMIQSKARYIKGRHCWGWLFQGQCQKGVECAYVHVKQGELAEIVRKRHPGPDAIREGTTKTSYYEGKKKRKSTKRKRNKNRSSSESESESGSGSGSGSGSSQDEKRRKRRKRRRQSSSDESGSSSE